MRIGELSALRRLPRDRPPVVLLGGLNVLRALGLGGIPAIVASPLDDEPALFSRYCVAAWRLPPLQHPGAVIESLESLAARLRGIFPRPLPLFFSNDEYLRLVNVFRFRLAARYRMVLNDAATASALIDKDRFAELAARRGLPVPRALDWERDLAKHSGPVLIKPAAKYGWNAMPGVATLFEDNKAIIRADGASVRADPLVQRIQGHLVFQEYITGGDRDLWCFDGVADDQGEVLACHTGRKLRCAPPLTGDSSYIELRRNAELESIGRDVAATVPLKGIFNMDFKRDARTGGYYLLEINARCSLWNYIGARNGLNLAKVYYEYVVSGARPEPARFRRRYRWIDFKLDRAALRALAEERRFMRLLWMGSLMRPKVYSVFAWRDPGPMLHALASKLRRRINEAKERRIKVTA